MLSSSLRVAVVCVSNISRSMETHSILRRKGLSVWSFGTESHVRLPGPRSGRPVVYDFATTYKEMYNDLLRKNRECYTHNGILHILGRNERIKPCPERFQECTDLFDVIFTCEESVYDTVVEDLCSREQQTLQPVYVINMDIKDTLEDATLGAFLIYELCQCLQQSDYMEDSLEELLLQMEEKAGRSFLHTVCFY
ncbi:RNA polymerase II subunit A C-terminal domain phosphatase SSU72-like [Trachypithecus francoisi]|uniref:RNA polymerase II subunit A C-terminal domain phosphatase SSU72-like n=1 Tax=Trachypithecus francoisi TaxID=54180 RepID=UPI00141B632C|nr:RNA polymerase II subunit A C-terminal domain phosphatase SSU72-like [Trachypithecus francoisi]